ncbi:3'(2'),5'-bisphosphate nucleotidase CysQ [Marinomonas sp. 15G1-11]|uniref:3'(2'),5'-bisphosphate nucleotidase CysQ n=1 Tax=Marinomonas phaeophyticola TaxID=3004091 RepID=A0ABT4JU50_9GAMM|nr:3'(2'),5'-bisphosphate nucleotidase CysQ [Marinomonas sp. 15G1-11]MCZ2721865.1 3'(2'),5'-bisphosphate nucleotidase CysQ [Marinomonas sp. 15G1-11]
MKDVHCHPFFIELQQIIHKAADAIMEIYQRHDLDIQQKSDDSPVTAADMAAHHIILAGLNKLTPDIPVLSEEGVFPFSERVKWPLLWVVDPLDGTKEFIKRNGEFSINIALVEHHVPILGMVYLPVTKEGFFGVTGEVEGLEKGAIKWTEKAIQVIATREPESTLVAMTSRSHGPSLPDTLKAQLLNDFSHIQEITKGSSIKACRIAEGVADIHLRRGPTSEWDTAATQAIVEAAGGVLMDFNGIPFAYNKRESLLNGHFFVATSALAPVILDWYQSEKTNE